MFRSLVEEYPDVLHRWYPWAFERDFVMTWEPIFCKQSMLSMVGVCALYLVLCFGGQAIMKRYQPFDLKGPLAIWNLFLATFSLLGTLRTLPFLVNSLMQYGLYKTICEEPTKRYGSKAEGLWVMLFIFSKVPELFDTAFIVLRKKPLIFLHWYHHITVLLFCWHAYATLTSIGIFFIVMNYAVHAIMYFYYFLSAIGYRPPWALLVTIAQLSQMVLGIFVCGMSAWYLSTTTQCYVNPENLRWGIIMYSSYFALFLKFFLEKYFFKKSRGKSEKKKL